VVVVTKGPRSNSAQPLMFALPHHIEALSDPKIIVKPEIRIQSRVTGVMRLCRGDRWLFKENVSDLRNYGITPYRLPNGPPLYDPLKVDLLRQVMVKELDTDFDSESNLDSYCKLR
jgi:endoglucanase Acf2